MKILISACLLGLPCRYDGKSKNYSKIKELLSLCEAVPYCPECYGGLPIPRPPSEIQNDKVISKDGHDVTYQYHKGAEGALFLCKHMEISAALLKEKSPSCGKGKIYDGSFTKTLIDGDGITARLLSDNGITIYGETQLPFLIEKLRNTEDLT